MELAGRSLCGQLDRPRRSLQPERGVIEPRGVDLRSAAAGERGHFHHIAGPYLANYARESTWREDNRRVSNGDRTQRTVGLAMSTGPSVDFCGYWQRHKAA